MSSILMLLLSVLLAVSRGAEENATTCGADQPVLRALASNATRVERLFTALLHASPISGAAHHDEDEHADDEHGDEHADEHADEDEHAHENAACVDEHDLENDTQVSWLPFFFSFAPVPFFFFFFTGLFAGGAQDRQRVFRRLLRDDGGADAPVRRRRQRVGVANRV